MRLCVSVCFLHVCAVSSVFRDATELWGSAQSACCKQEAVATGKNQEKTFRVFKCHCLITKYSALGIVISFKSYNECDRAD